MASKDHMQDHGQVLPSHSQEEEQLQRNKNSCKGKEVTSHQCVCARHGYRPRTLSIAVSYNDTPCCCTSNTGRIRKTEETMRAIDRAGRYL